MPEYTYSTSESVSEGHPDKVADQISDVVLDFILEQDPQGRSAIETFIGPGFVLVGGEAHARVDSLGELLESRVPDLVRQLLRDVGYGDPATGLDVDGCRIEVRIGAQSREIRDKVDRPDGQIGAGDQGIMFGYACDETEVLMPAAIDYAHRLMRRQAQVRKSGELGWLLPDAKTQVTVRYRDGVLDGIDTIVLSAQHRGVDSDEIREGVLRHIVEPVVPEDMRTPDFQILVNPGGSFTVGGPAADCGMTGRKIVVDTYGGTCPHGGGAFSGKDPSKVDRSAAYAARHVAKSVVAAGLSDRCMVQLAYAIGEIEPISVRVDALGGQGAREVVCLVKETYDLSPMGIIERLGLTCPIYRSTAAGGHFGREFPWEGNLAKL